MAIVAEFKNGAKRTYTKAAYQYDKAQKLIINGIELPESYEIHISNSRDYGIATAITETSESILIPDMYFETGEYIYMWIYAYDDQEDEGRTVYEIIIPVIQRPHSLPAVNGSNEDILFEYTENKDV